MVRFGLNPRMWSVKSRNPVCAALQSQRVITVQANMLTDSNREPTLLTKNNLQVFLVKSSFLFAFVGQTAVRSFAPDFHVLLFMHCDDLQVEPTLNGTSFDFVTTENGPVCLDLYSTPQYKLDQPDDCKGERCFPVIASNLTFPTAVKLNPIKMCLLDRQ